MVGSGCQLTLDFNNKKRGVTVGKPIHAPWKRKENTEKPQLRFDSDLREKRKIYEKKKIYM